MPGAFIEMLVSLNLKLSLAREMSEIYDIIRKYARDLIGADGVTFILRDGDFCHYVDESAISPLWKGQRFPIERCISGWAMLNRQVVQIDDIATDDRIPHTIYASTFVRSLIMVPVRMEDPIAAIGAYWADKNAPTERMVETMQIIANSAAVAMTNISLIESLNAAHAEVDRANAAKTRFLSNLGHELRTPLNAIIGFAELIQCGAQPAKQLEYADYIIGSGRQLLTMISDLLDVASLTEGRYIFEKRDCDLIEMTALVCQSFSGSARLRGISIKYQPHDSAIIGHYDARAIRQCLTNLLSNAIKFSPSNSEISVQLQQTESEAMITVTDYGIGMSQETLNRSTQLFEQPARERGQYHQGMGIGLAVCRALVDLHQGRMTISSSEQEGTTVVIWLPLATKPALTTATQ